MKTQDLPLEIDGVKLWGQIYLPQTNDITYPSICLCHGLPRGTPRDANDPGYPALAEKFSNAGFLTAIFNFRGAGESGGNFDILGWTRDLTAVLDHIFTRDEVDKHKIAVVGFSAGAAVGIYVAAHDHRVSAVISCASPTVSRLGNNTNLAKKYIAEFREMGIIRDAGFPPSLQDWMASFNHVYSLEWVSRISPRPLLILHGDADEVVPVASSRALYRRAKQPKQIMVFEGAGHQLRRNEQAMDSALEWLRSIHGIDPD